MSRQITDTILMIRPKHFGYNSQTAVNNSFQTVPDSDTKNLIQTSALKEFDAMVKKLTAHGINVIVQEDSDTPIKPDAIFPNNWVSFHDQQTIITYPMFAENRRIERREDLIDSISEKIGYTRRYNFEFYEVESNLYLEGTGSMILDRVNKVVYACLSPRTSIKVLDKFCVLMGYRKQIVHAYDENQELIYHTNVMMAVGTTFAIVCMDSITDDIEKAEMNAILKETGKALIPISIAQMNHFAGNMLQVASADLQDYLVMSSTAYNSLTSEQIDELKEHTKIINIDIPTIEKYGGGSVRCMMAELF